MSQKKHLSDVVTNLRKLADSIEVYLKDDTGSKPIEVPKESEVKNHLSLEDVRKVLAEKSQAGHTAKIKALLEKHGAKKLSDINPELYLTLLQEAEAFE